MNQKSSKATWQAVYSMFGPFAIANILMLAAIVVFVVFQPDGAPIPVWAGITVALFMLIALGFIIKGVFG